MKFQSILQAQQTLHSLLCIPPLKKNVAPLRTLKSPLNPPQLLLCPHLIWIKLTLLLQSKNHFPFLIKTLPNKMQHFILTCIRWMIYMIKYLKPLLLHMVKYWRKQKNSSINQTPVAAVVEEMNHLLQPLSVSSLGFLLFPILGLYQCHCCHFHP